MDGQRLIKYSILTEINRENTASPCGEVVGIKRSAGWRSHPDKKCVFLENRSSLIDECDNGLFMCFSQKAPDGGRRRKNGVVLDK